MRIAFIIQSHTKPEQIRRLTRAINLGWAERIIVLSHNDHLSTVRDVARQQHIDVLIRAYTARGRFSYLQGYLDALTRLHTSGFKFDWVVHLTGQEYPTAPLWKFAALLEATDYDGFFHHFDPFDAMGAIAPPFCWDRNEGDRRYSFQYQCILSDAGLPVRIAAWLPKQVMGLSKRFQLHTSNGLMLGIRSADPPFSQTFKCFAGSASLILNKKSAEAILDGVSRLPKLRAYYENVAIPEESYLQTILLNRQDLRISPIDLRYYDFSGERHGHARTLTSGDLEAILGKYYFARKFDIETDPATLDRVDRYLSDEEGTRQTQSA